MIRYFVLIEIWFLGELLHPTEDLDNKPGF